MKANTIKFFLFGLVIALIGCTKDPETIETNEDPNDNNNNNTEDIFIQKSVEGQLTYGAIDESYTGIMTIDNTSFTVNGLKGNLYGTIDTASLNFDIAVSSGTGIFNVFNSISGTYDSTSFRLNLSGTSINNQPLTFTATAQTIEEANQDWHDSQYYTGIYFSHSESCNASIYIYGEVLGPLETYWNEGGMCSDYQSTDWVTLGFDGQTSRLLTASGMIEGLDGNYIPYEHHWAALFILPKNQQFTYYVDWDNGESTEGTFTTPDGGLSRAICISNNGEECNYDEPPTPTGITTNTLEIDVEINQSPYTIFDFDELVFKIRSNRSRMEIGNYSSNGQSIVLNMTNGQLSTTTFDFDTDENTTLYVLMGGSAVFNTDFTVWDFLHGTDTKGNIQITELDYESGTATLHFNDVLVNFDTNFGSQYFRFSGTIAGNFVEEE